MPVLPVAHGVTVPLPLEPDIEHIRRLRPTPAVHSNVTSSSLCSSSLHLAIHLRLDNAPVGSQFAVNCTDLSSDVAAVGSWWIQLALGHDVIYYAFPVMLAVGLVCDFLGACALIGLVYRRARRTGTGRCTTVPGSRCQGNVYLLWNVVSGAVMLASCWTRRLPEYVDLDVGDGGLIRGGLGVYVGAVEEWLTYASLWLLVAMDLDKALQLTASDSEVRTTEPPPSPLLMSSKSTTPFSPFTVDDGIHRGGTSMKHISTASSSSSSLTYRKEAAICCAVYAVCLVSSLPHFFSFQLVETFDVLSNRTLVVPRHSDELTDSFEFRVVYYWYVVCLTVLLPVPVLVVVSVIICRAMASRRRNNTYLRSKHKRLPSSSASHHNNSSGSSNSYCSGESSSIVVVRKSSMARKSTSATGSGGSDAAVLSGRLLVVTTALYLLFTGPRTVITCLEGLPSSRWTALATTFGSDELDAESSLVSDMIGSLTDFSFYLYYASSLPLLCSYHDDVHAALTSLICCCCTRRCRRTKDSRPINGLSLNHKHIRNHKQSAAKKTVKFDSRTIEIEIQC